MVAWRHRAKAEKGAREPEDEVRKTGAGNKRRCSDNSLVEYAERDPYEGLVEGEDYPNMILQSGYEEKLWRRRGSGRELGRSEEEAAEDLGGS